MKPCNCCEGIALVTPLPTANQPGLNTLAYRVGNHATFLETMKARLSSLVLGDGSRPLANLTARDGRDAAIAWLDGWATVADVLTFYQERLANEGYLRTAAERRSILELARLVGYALRPGVAATVYLAFTVDNGYTITIPAGSRAQSIPGPGELPQSFETADPLPARDVWNTLKPRQTRLQAVRGNETDLYLAGINLNLKPGDPLLFVFHDREISPLIWRRADSVTVQAAENRTLVMLQSMSEAQQVIDFVAEIRQLLAGLDKGPRSEMADRVMQTLAQFQTALTSVRTINGLTQTFAKVLPPIQEEHKVAVDNQYSRLIRWVGGVTAMLAQLAEASTMLRHPVKRTSPLAVRKFPGEAGETAVSHLAHYLTALSKPPSQQPANSLQLPRTLNQTYAADSDMAPKLLAALRPNLKPLLYRAWQKQSLTPSQAVDMYTFRTRASVFGHNALSTESIAVYVDFESTDGETARFGIRITITAGGYSVTEPPVGEPPIPLEEGEFVIDFPAVSEKITVTMSGVSPESLALLLHFVFAKRPIVVDIGIDDQGQLHVSGKGSDPTTFKLTRGQQPESPGLAGASRASSEISVSGEIRTQANLITELADVVWLDTTYSQIVPGSWVVLERPRANQSIPQTVMAQVVTVHERSRADYGLSGKSTRLQLDRPWLVLPDDNQEGGDDFSVIRETAVLAQSDRLTLAETPIDPIAEAVCGSAIELTHLVDGLEAGRWLIIKGERTDIKPDENVPGQPPPRAVEVDGPEARRLPLIKGERPDMNPGEDMPGLPGLMATELVMLAGVEQIFDPTLPDEKPHTRLLLAQALAYCYKRDTVTIYGNVAKASHGETRREVLGSGNGRQPFPAFTLKQSPLTYVSDPNPKGIQSSLVVRVNDIQWHEAESLAALGVTDRKFITQTDNEDKTTVVFGNGRYGAPVPTGIENIKAVYRSGIGKVGNVQAEQISLLVNQPLGVRAVINPLRASGGADRDSLDQARRNTPLAVMALDRLVSTQDYADFARTFAGIGKASAIELTDGRRQVVHLTIAGVDDIPIDKSSDLYRHLRQALHQFGDPYQPIQIDRRQRKLLIISARVRLLADYLWEAVVPLIRLALLATFSFDRRDLGQDVTLSEVISTIQAVAGVAYVDVDILDAVEETADIETLTHLATTLALNTRIVADMAWVNDKAIDPDDHIQPAQLVYLSPDVPDTLILTEIT